MFLLSQEKPSGGTVKPSSFLLAFLFGPKSYRNTSAKFIVKKERIKTKRNKNY